MQNKTSLIGVRFYKVVEASFMLCVRSLLLQLIRSLKSASCQLERKDKVREIRGKYGPPKGVFES